MQENLPLLPCLTQLFVMLGLGYMKGFPFDSTHWKVKLRLRCNTFVGGHKNIGKRFGKFIKINQFQRFSSLGWSVYIIWPWHVFCIFCILQSIRSFCGQMTKRQFEYWLRRFSLTKIFQTLPKKNLSKMYISFVCKVWEQKNDVKCSFF